jgi:glycosyltransferase involved in cell wall biosynthesis
VDILSYILSENNAKLVFRSETLVSETPSLTVVMPVFNQQDIISENLMCIIKNASIPFDLIVVDDASSDGTLPIILSSLRSLILQNNLKKLTCNIFVFSCRVSWFETRCDDFAFRLARTKYILEIQADMKLHEFGIDNRLVDRMRSDPTLLALSGRGVHPLERLEKSFHLYIKKRSLMHYFGILLKSHFIKLYKCLYEKNRLISMPTKVEKKQTVVKVLEEAYFIPGTGPLFDGTAGWLDDMSKIPHIFNPKFQEMIHANQSVVYKGDIIMRGPLLVDRDKYLQLGGFDTRAFFLGFDESDLYIRGAKEGYKVGFFPLYYSSPEELGSTRKKRRFTSLVGIRFNRFIRRNNFKKSELGKYFLSKASNIRR